MPVHSQFPSNDNNSLILKFSCKLTDRALMAGKDSTVLKVSVAIVYASFLYEDVSQFTEKGTTVSMQRKKSFLEVLFFKKRISH